jgi:hypothetical protein
MQLQFLYKQYFATYLTFLSFGIQEVCHCYRIVKWVLIYNAKKNALKQKLRAYKNHTPMNNSNNNNLNGFKYQPVKVFTH